jgi:hypothetical protein
MEDFRRGTYMAQKSGNPWALRITIIGLVFILLGSIAIFSNVDKIDEAASPKKINEASLTGDGSVTVELSKSCYSAITIDDEVSNVSLFKMAGSNVQDEPIETSNCKTDWTPMDSDGSKFVILEDWDIDDSGEYVLQVVCENGCENSTVWLVDATSAQWKLLEQPALVFGGATCCLGIIILPIAFILYQTNKNGKGPKMMMVGANGQMMPITDLTPENIAKLQHQAVVEKVDNPFADTGLTESSDFVDGSEDVQNGTLLTTEQVFALMKGDVDEAQSRVSDPFADYNRVRTEQPVKKVTNTKEIASWDEGDNLFTKQEVESKTITVPDKVAKTTENKPLAKPNAWKDWDGN